MTNAREGQARIELTEPLRQLFETSDREAHDKCCDVQNNERTFMNCVQISKKAQRNWSTAGKQAFPLKYEQIGN